MIPILTTGTVLQERYEIAGCFGSAEGTAAYRADDRATQQQVLIWESTERFNLRQRPSGAQEYFQHDPGAGNPRHYLVLRLEGQTLAFVLNAAGRLNETDAGLWVLQICQAVGYWHNRESGDASLICLRQGPLSLSPFRLTGPDQVMIPSYGEFGQVVESGLPTDSHRFSAPEEGDALSPRSDVYALGALLYCLLTGQAPPAPAARLASGARLVPPQRISPDLSAAMGKVILKALQLDPARRYPTAAEMAADLEQFLIPRLMEKKEKKRKPSLLARLVPLIVTLLILTCVLVILQAVPRLNIKIPFLPGWPTPTHTPAPLVTATETVTPTLTPTLTPAPTIAVTATATPPPYLETVLNQVRLDQFPWIIAYVSILDENQESVRNMGRERFRVQQDGIEVADFQVANVDAAQDPLAMVLAIDISGSMKGEPLEKAKAAAANFASRLDTADQVCLIKFDDRIELVRDFTTDKNAIIEAIKSLQSRRDTALYDVIAQSVERLSTVPGRRAVIVLTDGRDTASQKHSVGSVISAANGSSIPVFVIGLDSPQFTPQIMDKIGSETGGEYLLAPSPDALDALYQKIRGQLQNQYRIEFRSLHEADGNAHTLRIGLDLGGGREIWGEKQYRLP